MNVLPTPSHLASASVLRAQPAVRGVGNASSSRTLDGERAGEEPFRRNAPDARRTASLSRIGTVSCGPLWNGPALRPSFVAQVLGQVMMDAGAQALSVAPAAYRNRAAQIAPALFIDGTA
jgi:hypothetical protein